jgi:hypothetical protein
MHVPASRYGECPLRLRVAVRGAVSAHHDIAQANSELTFRDASRSAGKRTRPERPRLFQRLCHPFPELFRLLLGGIATAFER